MFFAVTADFRNSYKYCVEVQNGGLEKFLRILNCEQIF